MDGFVIKNLIEIDGVVHYEKDHQLIPFHQSILPTDSNARYTSDGKLEVYDTVDQTFKEIWYENGQVTTTES